MSSLNRRPATVSDLDQMYQMLRLSLGPYVEQTWGVWNDAEQRRRFDAVTRPEDHSILELDGEAVGCLCLKQSELQIDLVRLFLLPGFQRRGLGTQVLKEVLDAADQKSLPVHLRVLRVNPARRLYERHGFVVSGESETHYTMVRSAGGAYATKRSAE